MISLDNRHCWQDEITRKDNIFFFELEKSIFVISYISFIAYSWLNWRRLISNVLKGIKTQIQMSKAKMNENHMTKIITKEDRFGQCPNHSALQAALNMAQPMFFALISSFKQNTTTCNIMITMTSCGAWRCSSASVWWFSKILQIEAVTNWLD